MPSLGVFALSLPLHLADILGQMRELITSQSQPPFDIKSSVITCGATLQSPFSCEPHLGRTARWLSGIHLHYVYGFQPFNINFNGRDYSIV